MTQTTLCYLVCLSHGGPIMASKLLHHNKGTSASARIFRSLCLAGGNLLGLVATNFEILRSINALHIGVPNPQVKRLLVLDSTAFHPWSFPGGSFTARMHEARPHCTHTQRRTSVSFPASNQLKFTPTQIYSVGMWYTNSSHFSFWNGMKINDIHD